MRITVSHNRPVEEVKQIIDRSFDDVFKSAVSVPVQFVQEQRTWQGDTLLFSMAVKFGPMSTPLKGFIEVTARDVTIDVDLGILERFISTEQVRGAVTDRIHGLLK